MKKGIRFACFVSSHGLGHATRMLAIIESIQLAQSNARFWIYSDLPYEFWNLHLSHSAKFKCMKMITDVGLVQIDPFTHNISQTSERLGEFLNFSSTSFLEAKKSVDQNNIDLVLCDISPLGIVVGNQLGKPTILIENFTWDWIYESFHDCTPSLAVHSDKLINIFSQVDLRIQCTPFCSPERGTVKVSPVFRKLKSKISIIKEAIGLRKDEDFILFTTGGILMKDDFPESINSKFPIVIPTNQKKISRCNNTIRLPLNSGIHFPDIVNASSCVIGKAGYGTICECWATNTPIFAIYRANFRESIVLKKFAEENLQHRSITIEQVQDEDWSMSLPSFLSKKRTRDIVNGAEQAANIILNFA